MEIQKTTSFDEQAIPRWIRMGAIKGPIGDSKWKWVLIGVFVLAFVLFMGLMVLAYQEEARIDTALVERGLSANGTVLDKYTEQRSSGRSTSTYYVVEYSFNGAGGKGIDVIFGKQEVTTAFYNSVQESGDVMVTYVQGEPEINRVEMRSKTEIFIIAFWILAVLLGVTGYVALTTWKMEQYKNLGQRKSKLD